MSSYNKQAAGVPSLSRGRRRFAVIAGLFLLLIAAFLVSTGVGSMYISPLDVLKTLLGIGQDTHEVVILQLRVPRMLTAVLVGTALAVSGAILQGIIRNPLASPDLVGITGGASVAAVSFLLYGVGTMSIHWLPLFAISGAVISAALMYVLAWKDGVSPLRMVLIGIGLATAASAITSVLLISGPVQQAARALSWMTGSVYGTGWKDVRMLLPWVGLGLPLSALLARHLNLYALGDELATGTGSRVQLYRFLALGLSVMLAGAAAAVSGAVAFVGLMAPHLGRQLVGPRYGTLIPASAMIGAILVLVSDAIARTAFHPVEIPAGVITSAIGAPFFIILLFWASRRR
ncbi:FecCD family ABC transporter permease [Paenibacillus thermoaerophilus]|uniref:FecCD family ABC transporter permease n=1 Tax=Paenibacillus thermoaerophilus TaxID=1215385 RepID=A0ABW2UXE4_9BACL|nr:iron ABC transporter permease [Paenibacillus thermoaerophilus]TMV18992.1 iron ABC transporter permease [Paenibacillus thermoaerophilus]